MENEQPVVSEVAVDNMVVKHTNKKPIILSFIVVIILVVSGIYGYASGYFVSLKDVTSESIARIQEVKQYKVGMDFIVDLSKLKETEDTKGMDQMFGTKVFNFKLSGSQDVTEVDNPKMDSNLSMDLGNIKAAMQMKMLDKTLYMNITEAPVFGFFSLKPIENKWVYLKLDDKSKETEGLPSLKELSTYNTLTEEERTHIVDITKKANLINITKRHSPEVVDGTLSFHFDYDLDKPGFKAYIKELAGYLSVIDKSGKPMPKIEDTDLDKLTNAIKSFKGQAWIGISDKLPRKFSMDMDLVDPEKLDDGTVTLHVIITYSDWGKPVKVEAPMDAVTIEKLVSSVMAGQGMGLPQ